MSDRADAPADRGERWTGPAVTVAAALVWLVLAVRTPTNTYHFAPLIAAAAWPVIARGSVGRPRLAGALRTTALSAGLALAVGFVLGATDSLRGPTLWSDDWAIVETVLFSIAGGVIGFGALYRPE